ncbi:hypothetical protein B9479_006744 [Cryptococcus floricola]|uniref:Inhibitor I9 domain-containing protein n=1 Tax=Cryptococcus floricola TaxID=2591691 RepID=A0A5D3APB1_9TREE|nr:hypothetical protein B9479_006744 [Cryptococcus floricola]
MNINLKSLLGLLFLATASFAAYAYITAPTAPAPQQIAVDTDSMADHTVIVQFKKTSSAEERKKAISELTSKGAKIVSDENADSKIFPFITVSYPKDDFAALEAGFGGGAHGVVQHVVLVLLLDTQATGFPGLGQGGFLQAQQQAQQTGQTGQAVGGQQQRQQEGGSLI